MTGLVQNRLTRIISLLIILCLSLSPIANGAMLSASSDSHASVDVEHQCNYTVNHEAKDSAPSFSVTAQDNGSEHGHSCNVYSSIAIELSVVGVCSLTREETITWSVMDNLNIKSSFLSGLDRPPRA